MGRRLRAAMTGAAATAAMTLVTGCGPLSLAIDDSTGHSAENAGPVTVAFGGDVHFEGQIRARLDADPRTALGPVAKQLSAADLAMVNLETAVTTGGTPAPKQFVFRTPPTAFTALEAAGVDVATMANNHGMDYGETGLRDSLAAAKQAKFPVVGIGNNAAEAYRPWGTVVGATKVGVIGATQVLDDNLIEAWTATDAKPGLASAKNAQRLVQEVQRARKDYDVLIVNLHWGQELNKCATDAQKQLADQLITAGADAVIGSHAHVLQAGGYLKGKYVHYGLGNFVFYNSGPTTGQTGVLTLTFTPPAGHKRESGAKVTKSHWAPAFINGGIPQPLTGAEAQQARTQWEGLRSCANVTANPA
ncbi:poly-gamma-glutamate synthesis protein (capsule biosynthesis protein) [Thermomonospora echinospora]|uniref:Poly-gamma-glutamate synthesis protein (Capsule biosynthesis protein) n=1 Tax=Thermomonospora echinospora TaxID=1992 RepID=A0A1H6CE31_9ACTN|nr:CapA family protein [Thermomonospora echinospora]SEG71047.1 poly-gamma-glutamate synthesis protein (capsule biosynthesis protein) [Thermomonospora echinospora]